MKNIILGIVLFMITSCGKEFLEIKQNQSNAVPTKIKDYQALLDDNQFMNGNTCHVLGYLGGDEIYVRDQIWNNSNQPLYQKNAYIWSEEGLGMESIPDWNYAYKRIFHANIVLDGIENTEHQVAEQHEWDNVKGSALFFRAFNFFQLAQQFCNQYDLASAHADLGIPLRLDADITTKSKRASVAETYERIISDLSTAAELLPIKPLVNERPSQPAANALLARVYLQMGNYSEALASAEACLLERNVLFDFNELDIEALLPDGYISAFDGLRQTNPEVLFLAHPPVFSLAAPFATLTFDTTLMAGYASNDLRSVVYFSKYGETDIFRGSYTGDTFWFTGLAVDEVILIKAECLARLGQHAEALLELNRLLAHRYDKSFVPLQSDDADTVLRWLLEERTKELFLRGLRWPDLRRLNMNGQFTTKLVKYVNGERLELSPNDVRYTWPLPYDVILQSGMEQNPR